MNPVDLILTSLGFVLVLYLALKIVRKKMQNYDLKQD